MPDVRKTPARPCSQDPREEKDVSSVRIRPNVTKQQARIHNPKPRDDPL